jgi:hypothetical protein
MQKDGAGSPAIQAVVWRPTGSDALQRLKQRQKHETAKKATFISRGFIAGDRQPQMC